LILADLFHDISDVFFPPLCISCANVLPACEDKVFCGECRQNIHYINQCHCPVCGITFPDSPSGNHLCGSCLENKPHYSFARAALAYEGIILDAIHQFKYGRNISHGALLAGLLADFNFPDMDWSKTDLMIPVPLHIRRLRNRGFNQALILARALGQKHGVNVDFSLLKRRKLTLTQTGLDKKERALNIKGAFVVVQPARIKGKNIILVDDVLTTGATINECAKTLKKAGAKQVAVITLARVL
jgi:ComF family protein